MFRLFVDAFYSWRFFHLAQRKLHLTSWFIQEELRTKRLKPDFVLLKILNIRRVEIQRGISEISRQSDACSKCMGKCCTGNRNLFTALDFLIRKYSSKPLTSYGMIPEQNELLSNYHAVLKHTTYFAKTLGLSKNLGCSSKKKCRHLTQKGCSISSEDRPILCLIFTCKEFRDELPYKSLVQLAKLIMEIQSIEQSVQELFSKSSLFKARIRCALSI